MKEFNSVVLAVILALVAFWVFGSVDFALNMTALFAFFGLLEWANVKLSGKTISRKFWEWSEGKPFWRVLVTASVLTLIGVYFTLHLVYKV